MKTHIRKKSHLLHRAIKPSCGTSDQQEHPQTDCQLTEPPHPSHQLIVIYVRFTCRLEVIRVNNYSNWLQFGN